MEKINRTVYICDHCQEEFLTEEECKIHEEKCRKALIEEKTKEVAKEFEDYSTKLEAKMENFVKENNLSPEEILDFIVGVTLKSNNKRFSLPEIDTSKGHCFLIPKEGPSVENSRFGNVIELIPKESPKAKSTSFENLIDSIIKER